MNRGVDVEALATERSGTGKKKSRRKVLATPESGRTREVSTPSLIEIALEMSLGLQRCVTVEVVQQKLRENRDRAERKADIVREP
jgi:hypothetical protein